MARIKWRRCRGWCLSASEKLWNTCDLHHNFSRIFEAWIEDQGAAGIFASLAKISQSQRNEKFSLSLHLAKICSKISLASEISLS